MHFFRRFLTTIPRQDSTAFWKSTLLFFPSLFAAGLGYWQLQRKEWKEDLLETRLKKVFSEPVSLFDHYTDLAFYDRVQGKGTYQEFHSVFVGPRIRTVNGMPQQGFVLITPFLDQQSGRVVLVNRGWVPESWKTKNLSEENSESVVDGIVIENEKPNFFVPKNEPENGNWFFIDSTEIAKHCGLPSEIPIIHDLIVQKKDPPTRQIMVETHGKSIRLDSEEKYPAAKEVSDFVHFTIMPSDHTNYAIIWFCLSAATLLMSYRVIRNQRRVSSKHSVTRILENGLFDIIQKTR